MTKRYLIVAVLGLSSLLASAQNMYDAILFSQNEYYGTARSVALGNAMTAVGGDLGSIGINPAGSAVANYGQITFTPGLSISSVNSSYSPMGESSYGPYHNMKSSTMTMPNFGVTLKVDTGNRTGVKSYTLGIIANRTNQFEYSAAGFGTNSHSSKLAEYAKAAGRVDEGILEDYDSFANSDVSWDVLTAYQGGMFGSYENGLDYSAVTEGFGGDGDGVYHYVPGNLSQSSYVTEQGNKTDFIINLGVNVSDKLFLGANIATPFASFVNTETFYEIAVNPSQFPISFDGGDVDYKTQFRSATTKYQYAANIDGLYAKFGLIYLPFEGLRLGAAIQTPTIYTVSETWQYSAATTYTDSYFDDSQTSPVGEYLYSLNSPYSANFGVAYTFGKRGLVSLDYELTDYSVMRASDYEGEAFLMEDPYLDYNMTNKYFAGVSHALRLGLEYRVSPSLSLRAGYNKTTSPERYWTNDMGELVTADDYFYEFESYYTHSKSLVESKYYGDETKSYSFGFGYSSPGSFFADFAVKFIEFPDSTFSPYYDYDGYNAAGEQVFLESPKIRNQRTLTNVLLTLGWRF